MFHFVQEFIGGGRVNLSCRPYQKTDQFIPADFGAPVAGLLGDALDLRCVPLANGQARFDSHGDYVNQVARIVNGLTAAGYLLQSDAREIKSGTAKSDVGAPGACPN